MSAHNHWPFEPWLKLAVSGFRLSPTAFWEMSLSDWLTLTRPNSIPTMTAEELSVLQVKFPDTMTSKETDYDPD